jgi:hypothetical protein
MKVTYSRLIFLFFTALSCAQLLYHFAVELKRISISKKKMFYATESLEVKET